jgi:hypothetical protein
MLLTAEKRGLGTPRPLCVKQLRVKHALSQQRAP